MTEAKINKSYRDIKQIVLDRIRTRVWPPDSIMPSEVALVEEFSSTRTTVNRALRELADEGFLERRRKAGTRVLEAPLRHAKFSIPVTRDEVTGAGATYRYALIGAEVIEAPEWLMARLNLKGAQQVLHVRCMHYSDNAAFQFEERWIVIATVPSVVEATFVDMGPNEWLIREVPVTDIELSFMATCADDSLAAFLETSVGTPLFTAERITWLQDAPVTLARMHFAAGYRMTTRL